MESLKSEIEKVLKKKKEQILENKKKGKKLVLYVTNHTPIELFEAANVDYLSWDHFISFYGVPKEYIDKNVPYIYFPNDWCQYSLSNFVLEVKDPKPKVDLVTIAYTCDPITKMWEYIEKDYEIFYFNFPRAINDLSINYWCDTTELLKKKLEEMTAQKITEEKLKGIILKENEIREKLVRLRRGVFNKKDPKIKPSELMKLLFVKSCLNQEEYLDLLGKAGDLLGDIPGKKEYDASAFYVMGPIFTEPAPKVLWENNVDGVDLLEKLEDLGYKTMEENWLKFFIDEPYNLTKGKSMVRLVGERSYLWPKHPSLSPNEGIVESHQKMCEEFELKGAIFYNYRGCRLCLMESRLAEYMFESEGRPFKHIQFSGKDIDLYDVLDTSESFMISNQ